jgi:hypothetical protein
MTDLSTPNEAAELLPVRMLNEFVDCPRLAYLEWTGREYSALPVPSPPLLRSLCRRHGAGFGQFEKLPKGDVHVVHRGER